MNDQQNDRELQAKKQAADKDLCAASPSTTDNPGLRVHVLEMALRTPGLNGHHDVLKAAVAYQSHIAGPSNTSGPAKQQPAPGAAFPGYSSMPPHQQRVVDEHAELSTKIVKLEAFVGTDLFRTIDESEQARLRAQLVPMEGYRSILAERIEAFVPA